MPHMVTYICMYVIYIYVVIVYTWHMCGTSGLNAICKQIHFAVLVQILYDAEIKSYTHTYVVVRMYLCENVV